MKPDEAEHLTGMIRAAWDMYLDDAGRQAWTDFLVDQDADDAMAAFYKLRDRQRERPRIADFREVIKMLARPEEPLQPALPVGPFVIPEWVLRWKRARAAGDYRAFPEQVPYVQHSAPQTDEKVWVQPHEYVS
jgi:hypothetical protein